jgi:Penicillinase repressor
MATKSQTVQLAERLRDVQAKAGELRAQLGLLEQQERRLALALEVLAEEFGGPPAAEVPVRETADRSGLPMEDRGSVEKNILANVFTRRDGLTSGEVVELLGPEMPVKYGTVVVTLSRMVAKGLLRKEGKKLFLIQKGRKP